MDDGLKQRIIGAVVLVIAAVVFLPMLLTGQDETSRVEVEAPEPPAMDEREIALAAPVELPEPEPVPDIPPAPVPQPGAPVPPPRASHWRTGSSGSAGSHGTAAASACSGARSCAGARTHARSSPSNLG